MMEKLPAGNPAAGRLIGGMIDFFGTDRGRVSHALKVYGYTQAIAEMEEFDAEEREAAFTAAIFHDVGIKIAEDRFGSCTFDQQEEFGPPAAKEILEKLNAGGLEPPVSQKTIDRVYFLISRHHSPDALIHKNRKNNGSEDRDFRALIEADFLVNFEEGNLPLTVLEETFDRYFTTQTGRDILRKLFS
jgi:hypothetical protein